MKRKKLRVGSLTFSIRFFSILIPKFFAFLNYIFAHNWSDELKQHEIYGWHQMQLNGEKTRDWTTKTPTPSLQQQRKQQQQQQKLHLWDGTLRAPLQPISFYQVEQIYRVYNLFVCVRAKWAEQKKGEKVIANKHEKKRKPRNGALEIFLHFILEIGLFCGIHRIKLWTKLEMKNWPTQPSQRLAKKNVGEKKNKRSFMC